MLKAEDCLKAEEGRVTNYLHINSKVKLLFQVETELLATYEVQLLEKEHSGCAALLRDDKARLPHLVCGMLPSQLLLQPASATFAGSSCRQHLAIRCSCLAVSGSSSACTPGLG